MHQTRESLLLDRIVTISKLSWIDRLWFYIKLNKQKRAELVQKDTQKENANIK